jgi:hypothetical protein
MQDIKIKPEDKFEISGSLAVRILQLINTISPSQSAEIFLELQSTMREQALAKQEAEKN